MKDFRSRRQMSDLYQLPKNPLFTHMRKAREQVADPNRPPASAFSTQALSAWAKNYLDYAFKSRCPFSTGGPVFQIPDNIRITLCGDWGTGTDEANSIANQILADNPDLTIHLGDTYYVGDQAEINENMLGVKDPSNNYDPTIWPHGHLGSLGLCGNHEMYSNGSGFYNSLLPTFKLNGQQQNASYFCLYNQNWIFIGLDTGYNSVGIPIISLIPGVNQIGLIGGDASLRPEVVDWLERKVIPLVGNRGVVLLSHHQYYSAFEEAFPKTASQLWKVGFKKAILWYWGHEHRLAGYDVTASSGKLKAHGRCIGHGGMPLSLEKPKNLPNPLFYDIRPGTGYGINGYVNLVVDGTSINSTYIDIDGSICMEESWRTIIGGVFNSSNNVVTKDPNFVFKL